MAIQIDRPEVEALIQERMRIGGFADPQEAVLHALRASQRMHPAADLLAALRSSPLEDASNAPPWLQKSWASAKEQGLDSLSMDEIDAEIDAARRERHQPKP